MIAALLVNLFVSLVMLGLTFHMATENALEFYPSTIPVMVQAGAGALIALFGLVLPWRWTRFGGLLASSSLLGLLLVPAWLALDGWPGGDDGGAFGWMFIVGGGCAASFFIAMITMIIGVIYHPRGNVMPTVDSTAAQAQCQIVVQHAAVVSPPAGPQATPQAKAHPVHWSLWLLLAVPLLYLFWCLAGPITWSTIRSQAYPGGVEIRSTDRHALCPYPIPFFHHVSEGHQLALMVNGRQVLVTKDYKHLFPSSRGTYVVAQQWLFTGPMKIYNVGSDKWFTIEVSEVDKKREFPGHYYSYPFRFLRWDADGSFLVEVVGLDPEFNGGENYRQLWRIDAASGQRNLVEPASKPGKPGAGVSPALPVE